jgi:flagellar protein FlaG
MNSINPLPTTYGPVAAQRSGGVSPSPAAATGASPAPAAGGEAGTAAARANLAARENRETAEKPSAETLQQELDATMKDVQTSLRFRVDDEANRVVVSVVDQGSGDVIYQIPSDVALRIAKRMAELGSGMINESA